MNATQAAALLERQYGEPVHDLARVLDLKPPPWHVDDLYAGLPIIGEAPISQQEAHRMDAVFCGTCVDHCDGDITNLSATTVADLVVAATIASRLGRRLISFVGTGEEVRLVPGGAEKSSGWADVVQLMRSVFESLNLPEGSELLDTNDGDVWEVLLATTRQDRAALKQEMIDGLYHLNDGSSFPANTPFSYYYPYYRSNISHYRETALRKLFGVGDAGVLVVENLQQLKAVRLAGILNGRWPSPHLITLPSPAKTGPERATRAVGNQRVLLTEFLADGNAAFVGADADCAEYWEAIIALWQDHLAR